MKFVNRTGRSAICNLRFAWLPPALTAAAALALYAYAVRLPLFRDAMVMLRWLDDRSVPQLWIDALGFPYYRPLAWMFLKAFQFGPGRFYAPGMHAQAVALHALDGALVSLLARRLWDGKGRGAFALLSGLFFVSFPFNYEAVPVICPIFQLVVTGLILGTTLLYWESRVRRSRPLAVASLALGLACPFASEYGVTVGLLVLAVEGLERRSGRFERFSWRPLLYLPLAAVYLLIWFLVPKSRGEGLPLLSLATLGQKGVYFLQGLVFPVAPLASWIADDGPTAGYGLTLLLAVVALGLLAVFFICLRQGRWLAFGLAWFTIGILPLWPTLDLDYVLNGPRLFYVASVGIAMTWAALVALAATRLRWVWTGRLLALALALAILAGNGAFLARQETVLETGGGIADAVIAEATAHEDSTPLLFVNVPSWLSPKGYRFPLGWEGISIVPGYSDVADLVYVNTGRQMNVRNVAAPIIWKEWPLAERFYTPPTGLVELAEQLRWAARVYVVENGPAGLRLTEAGWIERPAALPIPQAVFDGRFSLRLEGLDGDLVAVRLAWWSGGAAASDVTAFLHVYDESGQVVAQADGYPLLGLYPAWLWAEGEVIHDVRWVTLPAGRYTVGAGMYPVGGGPRLGGSDGAGNPLAEGVALLGELER